MTTGQIPHAAPALADEHPREETGSAHQGGEEQLLMHLEPDQLVIDKSHPVSRAALGGRATAALWALRVFVLVVSAMVIYTFVVELVR